MSAATVAVNARFLAEPVTGLQRYGREVLRELDAMLVEGELDPAEWRFVLWTPEPPAADAPRFRHLEVRVAGRLRSHPWEQLVLPRLADGAPLLNLKNTAPVRGRRNAVVVHDLQVFGFPKMHRRTFKMVYRYLQPRAARRARVLYAVSESTARELGRHFGIPRERVHVTLEGSEHVLRVEPDPGVLRRHGLERDGYFLAVSSMSPNKNFPAILEAARRAELDVPLVIAGGTDPRVFVGSQVEALPEGAVHVGRVSDAELRALYEGALGFVFPSFYEGWGLPVGEAQALGCPVVASDTTSLPEVAGDAALYCSPTDVDGLAENMRRLAEDPALRADLARRGRERAAGFRWRDVARRIVRGLAPEVGAEVSHGV